MALSDWQPRPRGSRPPTGYIIDPDNPARLIPDMAVIEIIEDTLDWLDRGLPLREAVDSMNAKFPEHIKPLTHMGLKTIYDKYRPDHPRKFSLPKPTKERLPREERKKYRKRSKLTGDKIRLAHLQKRVAKQSAEYEEIKNKNKIEDDLATKSIAVVPVEFEDIPIPEDRTVIFKANPGPQSQFLSAWPQEVLYGGAAGGGKSYAMIADPMRYFDNKYFQGLLIRRTNDELRKLIRESQMLYPQFIKGATWSEKKSCWTFPSGAQMWFSYLDRDEDVTRYQGQDFSWVGIDELTQYPTSYPWTYLSSRLRTPKDSGLPLHKRATTNPGGIGHGWVKRMFIDPAPPGVPFPARDENGVELIIPDKDPDFPEDMWGKPMFYRQFIPAGLIDNPYLDWRYRANLMALPEAERKRLLEGDWTVAEGAAFPEFRIATHVCEPFKIPSSWMKFRSADYGYSDTQASAVHWYAVDPIYGTLYVYRELYVFRKRGEELGQMILEREYGENISYGVLDSSVWSDRGQTGPTTAEVMQKMGLRWRKSDRTPGSRVASKHQLHQLLSVDPMTGKPGIIFFDNCRQIIADLPSIPSAPITQGDDDIDRRYLHDHAYDSIRYGISSRPKGGMDWDQWATTEKKNNYADRVFGY